jgi:hypothetical protein
LAPNGESIEVLGVTEESRPAKTFNLTVVGVHTFFVSAGGSAVLVHNQNINLGLGYTGRVDAFQFRGVSSFEIHVYSPTGKEIGVHGHRGWIPKHNFSGRPPPLPEPVAAKLKGRVIQELRNRGWFPPKGTVNIKNNPDPNLPWQRHISENCP